MNWWVVQRILGLLLMMFSLTMLPPIFFSVLYADGAWLPFVEGFALTLAAGVVCWLPVRRERRELRLRDGFLVVASFWTVLGTFGAAPLYFDDSLSLSITDAIFESISGLTTTGATVLTGLDTLPKSILYYRQQLQLLGGMGIIVLAVAVLPMLGVGGMQLYRAETPGPVKDTKLTPRITETAKALWYVYLSFTALCVFGYWLAGMQLFDAVCHAFSTVAIGGFSTHNDSLSFWNSPTIEAVAIVFMTVAGINFALHFTAWRRASAQPYFLDPELKVYASLLFAFSVLVSFALFLTGTYETLSGAFRYGTFQVISAMTTTGFTTAPFYTWGGSLPVILITLAFIGGCAGSTAGGMKVIRVILLYRQSVREILRLVHPHAVIPVKIGGQRTSDTVISAVWGFFFLYIANFAVMTILLTATGLDAETAYSTVGACITNLGPALGQAGPNYAELNDTAKVILSIAMLLGRLEVYTLLVLLTPAFWRG